MIWIRLSVLAAASALAGWTAHYVDWGHSNTPAWVQGIGSVAAILTAIATVNVQYSRELRRQDAEQKNSRAGKLLSACMHGLHVRKILNEFIAEIQLGRYNDGLRAIQRERLKIALTGFQSVSFDNLLPEDARNITAAIITLSEMYAVNGSVDHVNSTTAPSIQRIMETTSNNFMVTISALDESYKALTGRSTLG